MLLMRIVIVTLLLCVCLSQAITVSTASMEIGRCSNVTFTLPTATTSGVSISLSSADQGLLTFQGEADEGVVAFSAGQTTKTVQICSLASTNPSVYQINTVLSGTDSSKYTISPTLNATISAHTVTVSGGTVSVPKGGCSTARTITLSEVPLADIAVNFGQLAQNGYYIKQTTASAVNFLNTSGKALSFTICSRYNATTSNTVVALNLSGNSADQFVINNGAGANYTLVSQSAQAQNLSASNVVFVNESSTDGTVSFGANRHGYVYYTVRDVGDVFDPVIAYNLSKLKEFTNNGTLVIHSQSDYLSYLYPYPRFYQVNKTQVLAGVPSTISLSNLLPNQTYVFCYNYESADGQIANLTATCNNFTTQDIQYPVVTVQITFESSLNSSQRNELLCYIVDELEADLWTIVNLRGESCNTAGSTPTNMWYQYTGSTVSGSSNVETVYLFANLSDTTEADNFKAWFATNSMNSTVLGDITSAVGVSAVRGINVGSSTAVEMRKTTSRNLSKSESASYTNGNIIVSKLQMSGGAGIVYVAVAPSTATNITAENVINCKTNTNTSLVACQRVILTGNQGQTGAASISVNSSTGNMVYTTATTDYVARPIIVGGNASTILTPLSVNTVVNSVTFSPSTISIAAGQCQNVTITLSTLPTSDVGFGFTTTNTSSGISLSGASNAVVNFTSSDTLSKTLLICAASNATSGSEIYTVGVSGTNAADFSTPSSLSVVVTNSTTVVKDITLPTVINVPRGGCSTTTSLVATQAPVSDVSLTFAGAIINSSSLTINNATTNAVTFLPTALTQSFTICAATNATNAVIPVTITGTDSSSFTVNGAQTTNLTVNVVSANSTTGPFQIFAPTFAGTTGTASLASTSNGTVYYTISQTNATGTAPLTLDQVMNYVKNSTGQTSVQGPLDFLTYSYANPRYLVVGSSTVSTASSTPIPLVDIEPNTTYSFCGYFKNTTAQAAQANASCSSFTTPNAVWPIYEAEINFDGELTDAQRNSLLCYFSNFTNATSMYIVNEESKSCNQLGSTPIGKWYRYSGTTELDPSSATVYFITTDNGTDSTSTASFKSMFTSDQLTVAQKQAISTAVGLPVSSGSLIGSTSTSSSLTNVNRTVTVSSQGTYSIGSVVLDKVLMENGDGIVYFAAAPASSTVDVTAENIINCAYNGSTQFSGCKRIALTSGEETSVAIPVASAASGYRLYSVGSTDYLKRVVLVNNLSGTTVLSSTTVLVSNNSITVDPSNFSIAISRCQSVNVSIGSLPPSPVTITFTISNTSQVYTNLSNNSITFSSGGSSWYGMSVCATSNASVGTIVTISSSLSGSSADLYTGPGNIQVTIAEPAGNVRFSTTNISVAAGGCSDIILISLISTATTGVGVNLSRIADGAYYLNGTSSMIVWVNPNSTSYTLICSYDGAINYTTPIQLTGTNSSLYNIDGKQSENITLTVIAPNTPWFSFVMPPSYDSYLNATINIDTNQQGNIYFQFSQLSKMTPNMTLSQIQGNLSNGTTIIQSQADFQSVLFTYPRDTRIGSVTVYAGKNNSVTFNRILPATIYRICGYYQSMKATVASSSAVCSTFTTPNNTWPVYRTVINFNGSLTAPQRNSLLCYFVGQVQAQSYNMVDERGESCGNAHQWYRYAGATANAWNSQVLYLITQDTSFNGSQPANNLLNMFSNNSLTSAQGSAISSAVGVTVLNSSYTGYVSHAYMRASNETFNSSHAVYSNGYVSFSQIVSSDYGIIYYGIAKSGVQDPTPEQLLNCVDGSNTSLINCTRLVLAKNQTTGMSFANISSGAYSVYAVQTNDYFMRPMNVTYGVNKWSVAGTVTGALRMLVGIAIALAPLILIV